MMEWIVTSSAMILIVIALRGLLKGKISPKLQYSLWALVLIRLLLPFSVVDSAISVSNLLSAPVIRQADDAVEEYESVYEDAVQRYESSASTVTDEEIRLEVQQTLYDRTYDKLESEYTQSGAAVPVDRLRAEAQQQVEVISLTAVITEALPWLWAIGMAVVAAGLIGSNLHFGWKLYKNRAALEIPGVPLRVYLTDYVATPCLFGFIRPDIYLTSEVMADARMQSHVIAHEMSHYRQADHIWSLLRCVCLVLHWYNPLVWAAAVLSKQDAELACDEATIRVLGEADRVAYGRTLIGMTCVRRDPRNLMLTATTMLGSKKTLKERIALIARKPQTALYTLIACVLVAVIAVGCTFTGAPAEPADPTTEPTVEPTAEPTTEPTEVPTDPNGVYEWEPAEHVSQAPNAYFSNKAVPIEEITTWLDWTAADGVSRYSADYGAEGLYVERLDGFYDIVWWVPNSEQYADVAIMLCDGVHVYGVRRWTELIRIDLKTGQEEILFTAEQMMCSFTADGSCKNIFIVDRDWLYFLAKNDGSIHIYRMYLPDLSVEVLGSGIPEDTLPTFLDLKYNPDDRTEITCTYVNPELQSILLDEINDPSSSYRDVTLRLGDERLDLNWVWEHKEELGLESTYYWYGPFDYLRVQLQNDINIAAGMIITCDQASGAVETEEVWLTLPDESWAKPVIGNPDIIKFQNLLTYKNGFWYWSILGCTFDDPKDINLEYVFYNGLKADERQAQATYTDSEIAFLKSYALEEYGDEEVWVNAHKLPRDTIEEVLGTYLGITLDEVVIPEDWRYFEETDAYYEIRFDAYGVNTLTVTDVQTDDNGLIYVYWTANYLLDTRYEELTYIDAPQMVMVLQERQDGGYLIHLNMPVEELLQPDDEE